MKLESDELIVYLAVVLCLGFALGCWASHNTFYKCQGELNWTQTVLNESLDLNTKCAKGYYYCASQLYNFTDNEKAIFNYLINKTVAK